jgi:hypothetical protein
VIRCNPWLETLRQVVAVQPINAGVTMANSASRAQSPREAVAINEAGKPVDLDARRVYSSGGSGASDWSVTSMTSAPSNGMPSRPSTPVTWPADTRTLST